MKNGYIPKDERKTILLLSDDLRLHSGIGTMSREIVMNTAHHFNWVQLGGAIKHPDKGKGFDISQDINKFVGIEDSSVLVIPWDGYGDEMIVRQLIKEHKPGAIMHFTDPRYWIWLYRLEREIRQHIPMLFYTIWDDLPYPFYNRPYYESDDMLLCISKQTHNLVKNVLRDKPKADWAIKYVPHGIDEKKFFPIANDFEFEAFREDFFEKEEYDFVIFWNSRNIRRKNCPDIITAWRIFLDQLPEEKAKRCLLMLHGEPSDPNGTDLPKVIETVCNPKKHKVKFTKGKCDEKLLNYYYNISDAHMFMTDNEGWGLGLTESLMAGRMIIAPAQGGMQDQMRFEDDKGKWIDFSTKHPSNADGKYKKCGEWALPMFPTTRSMKGSPPTPYIYSSQVSIEDAAITLMKCYKMGKEERERRGQLGREWVLSDEAMMSAKHMGDNFIANINTLMQEFTPRKRHELINVDDIPSNYNEDIISLTPEFYEEINAI